MWEICSPIQVFFSDFQNSSSSFFGHNLISPPRYKRKKIHQFSVSSCALTGWSWTTTWRAERRSPLLQCRVFPYCTAQLSACSRHADTPHLGREYCSLHRSLLFFPFSLLALSLSLSLYFAVTTMNMKAPPSGHYSLCRFLTHLYKVKKTL